MDTENSIGRTQLGLLIFTSAIIALRIIGIFLPEYRLWGTNHGAFWDFSIYVYLGLITVLFASLYLALKGNLAESIDRLFVESSGIKQHLFLIVIAALSFVLSIVFKVDSYFLGDSAVIIANPEMTVKVREIGEVYIHILVMNWLGEPTSENILWTYQYLAIGSGVLYALLIVYYSRKIIENSWGQVLFVLSMLMSASVMLYYGYVENYSIVTLTLTVLVLSSINSLKHNKKSFIPIILFIVSVALHLVSLVYLPAVLFYVVYTFGNESIKGLLSRHYFKLILLGCGLFLITYMLSKLVGGMFWQLAFLPVLGDQFTTDNYYLLSFSHIVDYVNLLIFLVPVTLLVFALKVLKVFSNIASKHNGVIGFLSFAMIFGMIAAFFIEPKLGMARDWDLMSTMMIGALIFGLFYIVHLKTNLNTQMIICVSTIVVLLSIYIPWLGLNNSVNKMFDYDLAVMKLDPKHSRSSIHMLGSWADTNNRKKDATQIMSFIMSNYPEKEMEQQGSALYKRGQFEDAIQLFSKAIEENPSWYALYQQIGLCQVKLEKYDLALSNLQIADGLNPYNAITYCNLGDAFYGLKDTSQALSYWNKSLEGDYEFADAHLSLGRYYMETGRLNRALAEFTQFPDSKYSPDVLYYRGLLYNRLGDFTKRDSDFKKYLVYGYNPQFRLQIEDILYNSGQ